MRILFFGTSEFAVPSLQALIDDDQFDVIAVFTQPDRPQKRGKKMGVSPIKELALKQGLRIEQPESVKTPESLALIESLKPDLNIVVSYGQILSQTLIDIPKYKTLNVHASLLPEYRGASPINAVLRDGKTQTGVTIMQMDAKLDHGPIISQATVDITPDDQYQTLSEKLANTGAQLLTLTIPSYVDGTIETQEQDHESATFTSLLSKEDGRIDWSKSATDIHNEIRAYLGFPTSYTFFNKKRVIILRASVIETPHEKQPGTFYQDGEIIGVYCGKDILVLEQLQVEGKKPISGHAFAQGYPLNGHSFNSTQ